MKSRSEIIVLIDESVNYQGLRLHYKFKQNLFTFQYLLSVEVEEDHAQEALGTDFSFAMSCYRAVRDGGVTPCTLADVIADRKTEKEKFAESIYKMNKK